MFRECVYCVECKSGLFSAEDNNEISTWNAETHWVTGRTSEDFAVC